MHAVPVPRSAAVDVDVVVPVYNEAAGLEAGVRRLHAFLAGGFPFSWRIVIADNGSTDATPAIARRLAAGLPGVTLVRLDRKGRGRALRAAWSASDARVVAYMDVDLSTDLRGVARLAAAGPIARFAGVGVASTLAYALLFLLLHALAGPAVANALALAITAVANTAANRRFTFRVRGRAGLVRQHALGAFVFFLTLGLTSGALAVLHGLSAHPSRALELVVLVAAGAAATVTRYVALRSWVFAAPECPALETVSR